MGRTEAAGGVENVVNPPGAYGAEIAALLSLREAGAVRARVGNVSAEWSGPPTCAHVSPLEEALEKAEAANRVFEARWKEEAGAGRRTPEEVAAEAKANFEATLYRSGG
jgi:hypothetical protein